MAQLKFFLLSALTAISCFSIVSCSSDDEPDNSAIVGTWSGTYTYYNPASGTKYQYLYLTFYSDGSGELEYEAPGSYSAASFTYSVSGNTVRCQGVYASTHDDSASAFDMTFTLQDGKLYPPKGGRFSNFILSRGGTTTSGDDSNQPSPNEDKPANYDKYSQLYNQLAGTSWKILSSTNNGKSNIKNGESYLTNNILTFANTRVPGDSGLMLIRVNGIDEGGFWKIDENGALYFCAIFLRNNFDSTEVGALSRIWGIGGTISSLTSDRMIITEGKYQYVFTSAD